jgi:hypothetical protein
MWNVMKEAFHRLSQKLSFAAGWIDQFLSPYYVTFSPNGYKQTFSTDL